MNIWFLTTEYPPFCGGGISTYVYSMTKMLVKAGHQVTVFVSADTTEYITDNYNLRIIRFQVAKGPAYYSTLLQRMTEIVMHELKNSLKKPDIIEVQDLLGAGYYLIQKKLLGQELLVNIPIIVHLHTPFFIVNIANEVPYFNINTYLVGHKEKTSLLAADAVICPSEFLKKDIAKYLFDKEIKVIPLPLPELTASKIKTNKNKTDLLFLGRIEPRKGIAQFLQVAEILWKKGAEFTLTVVGNDPDFLPENKISSLQIRALYNEYIERNQLRILNKVEQAEIYEIIRSAKIVVIPSTYENFPYACIEAMALKKPILASTSGGQAEIVGNDESCGLLFDWQKSNDAMEKLQKMLSLTDKQLVKMGKNAAARIRLICNHKKNIKQRLALYKNMIKNKRLKKNIYSCLIEGYKPQKDVSRPANKGLLSIVLTVQHADSDLIIMLRQLYFNLYKNIEIIIVDNGSTDIKTKDVFQDILKLKFPKLKIISLVQKQTMAFIRNYAVDLAQGEYICFLQPKYKIQNDYFCQAIKCMEDYINIDFVYSRCTTPDRLDEQNNMISAYNPELPVLFMNNCVTPGMVIKRNVFKKSGLNNQDLNTGYEDYESALKLSLKGVQGVCIPETLVFIPYYPYFSIADINLPAQIYCLYQSIFNSLENNNILQPYLAEIICTLDAAGDNKNNLIGHLKSGIYR